VLVGLSGRMGAGKTSVANYLVETYGFRVVSLAAPLYSALEVLNPYVDYAGLRYRDALKIYGPDAKNRRPEIRRLLQTLGYEVLRECFGADVLLRPVLEDLDAHPNERIVVPDVRYLNEVAALKARDAVLIRIVREDQKCVWDHVSETELTDESPQWDFTIPNRSTLSALNECVDCIMRKLEHSLMATVA